MSLFALEIFAGSSLWREGGIVQDWQSPHPVWALVHVVTLGH